MAEPARGRPRRKNVAEFNSREPLKDPVLVPVRASPVPSVVRGSFVVKFYAEGGEVEQRIPKPFPKATIP